MTLQDKAMLCALNVQAWTGRRIDKRLTGEVADSHGAARDTLSTTVQLVPRGFLKPITMIDGALRREHYRFTLPWLDDGSRILTSTLFDQHAEAMDPMLGQRQKLVQTFVRNLPAMKEHAQRELGDIYRAGDFPEEDEVLSRFKAKIRYLPLPSGEDFRVGISDDEADYIRRDMESDIRTQLDDNVKGLRDKVATTLMDFVERIEGYKTVPDDSQKSGVRIEGIFRNSVVDGVRDLAKLLPGLNLTDDAAIHGLSIEIRDRLARLDPETLRQQDGARTVAVTAARDIITKFGLK